MLLRRGIEEATSCPSRPSCGGSARPVEGRDELEHVATIAAKEDEVIGAASPRRSTASARGRRDDRGDRGAGLSVDFVEGMHVENGWMSPYMVRDPERMETVFEDPYILMTNRPISHPNDLLPALDAS